MLGYGIETTAQAAGISKNSVLRAEHGEDIRPVTARKIARALNVEVADLLGAESPKGERRSSSEPTLFNGLEDERRKAAYDVALNAATHQAVHDRRSANRALASEGIPQPAYFKDYENDAMTRLLKYPAGELVDALMQMARHVAELETQVRAERKRVAEARHEAETARSASA
jgi:hypothetical protein